MKKKFDYTRNARRFVARAPVFTFVLTQVGFWIIAYVFLAIIAHMVLLIAGPALQIKINHRTFHLYYIDQSGEICPVSLFI